MLFPQTLVPEPRLATTTLHAPNYSDRETFNLETVVVSIAEGNSDFTSIAATNSQTHCHADLSHSEAVRSVDFDLIGRSHRHQKSVLDTRMTQCGYPLQNVKTHVDEHQITLEGHVSRYYYMQVVLKIAMPACEGRQIVNNLDVVAVQVE